MSKIDEAKIILRALGMPFRQRNDNAVYTLLAFCGVGPDADWRNARAIRTNPHGVIQFARDSYGKIYQENTRETIRRQAIHQLVQGGILLRNPDNPALPTNSPRTHYALSIEALDAIRSYGSPAFAAHSRKFLEAVGSGLAHRYAATTRRHAVPVTLPNGRGLSLSPGKHNELQRQVIEAFLPNFAPGATLVYLGDTAHKALFLEREILLELGVPITEHDKLPDLVAFWRERNVLLLIEAVTSHGPVSPKRHLELEDALSLCPVPRVYISAFADFAEFKRHADQIAWETDVWLAEAPTHLLHYNGDKFLSPHGRNSSAEPGESSAGA